MDDHEQQILGLYKSIAIALIEASPEHLIHVEIKLLDRGESVAIDLLVSENPQDFFSPTEDLLMAVDGLGDLMRLHKKMFSTAKFSVSLNEKNQWGYHVEFEYST